jgi:branched-chain amino acid transport system substrate-binding protein
MPITYWAGADVIVQYAKEQEGGSLKGKKIALVYHDSAYGKEPIATLRRWPGRTASSSPAIRSPTPAWSRRRPGCRSAASLRPTGSSCGAGA